MIINTPRLQLRPWRPADLDAMTAVNSDAAVMKYFPHPEDRVATQSFIDRSNAHLSEHGFGFLAAELRAIGKVIGMIGLSTVTYEVPHAPFVEIGWRLHPAYWRKGLATEGARACLAYGFDELSLAYIYAQTTEENAPSRGVMEKIGMHLVTHFNHPKLTDYPTLEPCVLYRISAAEH